MKYFLPIACLLSASALRAQQPDGLIREGNRAYKKNDFDKSQSQYRKALGLSPSNANANYNLGNASFRKNNFEDADKSYDAAIQSNGDSSLREKAWYNKGVSLIKQKKLDESIDAWKNALKMDADDSAARDNLVRALTEKKKQDQQKKDQQDKNKKPDPKDDKNKKNQPQQPKQQQSKLTKQQVEQLLKALAQKEQEVQDKMNQNKTRSLTQQEKDW